MCPILHISITLCCICFLPAFRICQSIQNELIHCYHLAGNWLCLVPISAPPNASINKVRRKVVLLGSSYTKRTPPSGDLSIRPAWHQCTQLWDFHMLPQPILQLQTCSDSLSQMQLESIPFQNDLWISGTEVKWLKRLKRKFIMFIGTGIIYKRNKQLQ